MTTGCAFCDAGKTGLHKHDPIAVDPETAKRWHDSVCDTLKVPHGTPLAIDPLFDYFDFEIPPLEKEV